MTNVAAMMKCYQLRRLPKPQNSLKSILTRRQTPGDAFGAHLNIPGRVILDPSHPAANLPRHFLPTFRPPSKDLILTTVPFGLLAKPDFPRPPPEDIPYETWEERVARSVNAGKKELEEVKLEKWQKPNRLPISTLVIVPKKTTSKRKVVRSRISHRLKTALELVLIRNANVERGKLVFDNEASREKVDVLRGWTYVFLPSLELNLMPYTTMIPLIREAMEYVHKKASAMERRWAEQSMKTWKPKAENALEPLPIQPSRTSSRTQSQKHAPPLVSIAANDMDIFQDITLEAKTSSVPPVAVSGGDIFDDVLDSDPQQDDTIWSADDDTDSFEQRESSSAPSPASQLNLSPSQTVQRELRESSKYGRPRAPRLWGYKPLSANIPASEQNTSDLQWAKAYGNTQDMAKRKIFHAKPLILDSERTSTADSQAKMRVGDKEMRRMRENERMSKTSVREEKGDRKGKQKFFSLPDTNRAPRQERSVPKKER